MARDGASQPSGSAHATEPIVATAVDVSIMEEDYDGQIYEEGSHCPFDRHEERSSEYLRFAADQLEHRKHHLTLTPSDGFNSRNISNASSSRRDAWHLQQKDTDQMGRFLWATPSTAPSTPGLSWSRRGERGGGAFHAAASPLLENEIPDPKLPSFQAALTHGRELEMSIDTEIPSCGVRFERVPSFSEAATGTRTCTPSLSPHSAVTPYTPSSTPPLMKSAPPITFLSHACGTSSLHGNVYFHHHLHHRTASQTTAASIHPPPRYLHLPSGSPFHGTSKSIPRSPMLSSPQSTSSQDAPAPLGLTIRPDAASPVIPTRNVNHLAESSFSTPSTPPMKPRNVVPSCPPIKAVVPRGAPTPPHYQLDAQKVCRLGTCPQPGVVIGPDQLHRHCHHHHHQQHALYAPPMPNHPMPNQGNSPLSYGHTFTCGPRSIPGCTAIASPMLSAAVAAPRAVTPHPRSVGTDAKERERSKSKSRCSAGTPKRSTAHRKSREHHHRHRSGCRYAAKVESQAGPRPLAVPPLELSETISAFRGIERKDRGIDDAPDSRPSSIHYKNARRCCCDEIKPTYRG